MSQPPSPRPGPGVPLVWAATTAVAAVPLWWAQPVMPEVAAAYPWASAAPLVGAVVTFGVARVAGWRLPLELPRWSGRVGRRALVGAVAALLVILGTIQLRTFFGWSPMPLQMVWLQGPLPVVALITLAAVTAQEIGFRGVLHPHLAARHGRRVATVATGLAWTAWALPGVAVIGPAQVVLLAVTLVALSFVIDGLGSGAPGAALLSAIAFRWVLALGLLVSGDEEAGVIPGMAILAGVSVAAALVAPHVPRWGRMATMGRPVV